MCICIYMSIILCRNMCTDIFSFYAFIMKNKVLLYLYCMFYNCVVFVIVNKKTCLFVVSNNIWQLCIL